MNRRDAYSAAETRRLLELVSAGEPVPVIANTLGRSVHSVRQKTHKLRRAMPSLPARTGARRLYVSMSNQTFRQLRDASAQRDLEVSQLAAELLGIIAR